MIQSSPRVREQRGGLNLPNGANDPDGTITQVEEMNLLGEVLARTLDLTNRHWLARYVLTRFPYPAQSNPTLPPDLVDAMLRAAPPVDEASPLLKTHELTPAQFRKLATTHDSSRLLTLLRTQRPPTPADLLTIVENERGGDEIRGRFETLWFKSTATFALRNAEWTRYSELTKAQQRHVQGVAAPDACLYWLSTKECTKSDWNNVKRWLDVQGSVRRVWGIHEFVERQHEHIATLVALECPAMNEALAMSQWLRNIEHQRAVLGLDMRVSSQRESIRWLSATDHVLNPAARNPYVAREVLVELDEHIATVRTLFAAAFAMYPRHIGLRATLQRRLAAPPHQSVVTQDLSTLEDTILLDWAVKHATNPLTGYPLIFQARELLQNPLISKKQEKALRDALSDTQRSSLTFPAPASERRTQYTNSTARRAQLHGRPLAAYLQRIKERDALPATHSAYFHQRLGENKEAWDAFFALGQNWCGTLNELVDTTCELTHTPVHPSSVRPESV